MGASASEPIQETTPTDRVILAAGIFFGGAIGFLGGALTMCVAIASLR